MLGEFFAEAAATGILFIIAVAVWSIAYVYSQKIIRWAIGKRTYDIKITERKK